MTYSWNTNFENYPTNSDRGLTMGVATRSIKAAFEERFEQEHNLDYSSSAICSHKVGECSVCGVKGSGVSDGNQDALFRVDSILYRDTGSVAQKASVGSHQDLEGRSDDDHTQYFEVDGSDDIDFSLDVPQIIGLPTGRLQSPVNEAAVLSRGEHDISSGGEAAHADDIFDASNMYVGSSRIEFGSDTFNASYISENITIAGGYAEKRFSNIAANFVVESSSVDVTVFASKTDHDDFISNIRLKGSDDTITIAYWEWN